MNTNLRIALSLGLIAGFVATLFAAIFTPGLGLQHAVLALALLTVQGIIELAFVGRSRAQRLARRTSAAASLTVLPSSAAGPHRTAPRRAERPAAIAA